jgi:hypothetical protein
MDGSKWESAAAGAIEVLLDPSTDLRHKLGAILLFTHAATFSAFDVEGSLRRLFAARRGVT